MKARTLMVQGTASSVGKSLLVTALCRIYARRGLRVAPFKSQNMALNSAVTPDGAEIGRAQFAQAEAARVTPTAHMNPILLKPEGLSSSQVVVLGRPIGSMHFSDYHERKRELRDVVGASLDQLRAAHDVVIIEGAGSPAEVNLKDRDLVNMWVAERADAKVVLVTDIDRGGALAALVGTLELLDPPERARVGALVVNKFRGDPSLFDGGVRFLVARTGIPVCGVVGHLGDAGIASEDSLDLRHGSGGPGGPGHIAIVKLPRLSNFDEFEPLQREPQLNVRFCERPAELAQARLVILPGTKCTANDLLWLRESGMAGAVVEHAHAGGAVLGICGGFQMLGDRVLDPDGVESSLPDVPGLGLLPLETRFHPSKVTQPVTVRLSEGLPLLGAAGGARVRGYEIHCGRVHVDPAARPFGFATREGRGEAPEGAVRGTAFGTLIHGLFEDPRTRAALGAQSRRERDPYDALADHFEAALDLELLDELLATSSPA